MRIIGIDFGEKRIGVAAAEDRMRVAIPLTTLEVGNDPVDEIVAIAERERADALVVGLPLSLSGALGPQAQRVMAAVEQLSERLPIPVTTWDERLTSAEAGRRAAPAKKGGKSRRRDPGKDSAAAAILLQAYLDNSRPYE